MAEGMPSLLPDWEGEPDASHSYSDDGSGLLGPPEYANKVFSAARQGRRVRGDVESTPQEEAEAISTGLFDVDPVTADSAESFAIEGANYTESDFDPIAFNANTLPQAEYPTEENPDGFTVRDGVNFLFGEDMAILGIKWDEDGLSWKKDTFVEQWTESPVMSTIAAAGLVATAVVPVVGVLRKSAKVGKIAQWGVTRYVDEADKATRALSEGAEMGVKTRLGTLTRSIKESSLLKYGDDFERLADDMLDAVDDAGGMVTNNFNRYFDDKVVAEVKQLATPAERLKALGGRKALKQALLNEDHANRFNRLRMINEVGNPTAWQRTRYQLQKRFSNQYFELSNTMNKAFVTRMDDFLANAKFDELFKHGLDEDKWEPLYKYLNDALPEGELAQLDDTTKEVFQRLGDRWESVQTKARDLGLIDEETFAKVGRRHIPALHPRTPEDVLDVSESAIIAKSGAPRRTPKLSSATLMKRDRTTPEIIQAMERGEVITNPDVLLQTGLMRDELLIHNHVFLRDLALSAGDNLTSKMARFAIKPEAFHRLNKAAQKNWIPLDSLGSASTRLRRMVAKKLGKNVDEIGEMPYIHHNTYDQLFDPDEGAFSMAQRAADFLGTATAIHKTAVTSLNLPTHFMNLAGNLFFFMPMAGVNPLNPSAINDMRNFTRVFKKIAKARTPDEKKIAKLVSEGMDEGKAMQMAREHTEDIFTPQRLDSIFKEAGVDPMIKTNMGTDINMIDELLNPSVRQLIEEQSFDAVEGFTALEEMVPILESRGGIASRTLAAAFAKTSRKVNRYTNNSLHKVSSAYLAEDMVPKFASYLAKRRNGLNVDSSVLEIGRRFPQYKTVGKTISGLRKFALPWVTFPSEAMRIVKNNLMDKPLAMLPWLHSPGILQATFAGIGAGPRTPEEAQTAKESAPFWASKHSTVVTNPQAQGGIAGGATGAFAGYTAGGLAGGPLGALIGAAGGAAAGAAAGLWGTKDEDDLRAWALDFMPHASLTPSTTNPYAEPTNLKQAMDLSPLEPFAVLMPVINTIHGKGSFGQDIPTEGLSDAAAKGVAGVFGMLMPPWMQKYGMKMGQPSGNMMDMSDLSLMGLGGTAGAVAGGMLAGPAGAATGALFGGSALATMDTARFYEDMGFRPNSSTGERGNPVYDVLFNSVTGVGKSWRITPEQRAMNEKLHGDSVKSLRTYLKKQMVQATAAESDDDFNDALGKYHRTFIQQYEQPAVAQEKFTKSMERLMREISGHPQLRRMSKEDLVRKFREASAFATENRQSFMDSIIESYRQELIAREIGRVQRGDSLGYDRDVNLSTFEQQSFFQTDTSRKKRRKRKPAGLFDGPSFF